MGELTMILVPLESQHFGESQDNPNQESAQYPVE